MKTAAFASAQSTLSIPVAFARRSTSDFWEKAEKNGLAWSFSVLLAQTTLIAPLVLWSMLLAGGGDWQFAVALLSSFGVLIPILSALSVRVILPIFATSAVVNLSLVLLNAAQIFLK